MTQIDQADTFITSLGLEAYRVGGSVRDEVLGRRAKDADYMVRGSNLPEVRKRLMLAAHLKFTKYNCSSLKLRDERTVGCRFYGAGMGTIEVALPRTEVSTGPGRQDFEIVVDPALSLEQDSCRRDFTFNALYKLMPGGPVSDPTGAGLHDLQHKLIRTTHEDSFRDDPLRTLRALRFVSTLGFDDSRNTVEQMQKHAESVTGLTQKGVSGTVLDELSKLLMGADCARALRLARDTGVLAVLLPELAAMLGFDQGSRYHDLTTDEHTFKALETAAHVDAPLRVRLALLFHDAGKPAAAWTGKDGRKHYYANDEGSRDHEVEGSELWLAAAQRLNVPSALRKDVNTLILNHMVPVRPKVKSTVVRRQRVQLGDELLKDLFLMRSCDLTGKGKKVALDHIHHIAMLEKVRKAAADENVPCSIRELNINGNEVKALGFVGRDIGRVLNTLLDEVACNPKLNDHEWLISRAGEL